MNKGLVVINPLLEPHWDEMLLANNQHSFFHSAAWAKALSSSYGFKPVYFAAIENNVIETLVPFMEINTRLMPKKGVSLPFSDFSEPIVAIDNKDIMDRILDFGALSKWKTLEIRGAVPSLASRTASAEFYNHQLALQPDPSEVFKGFSNGNKGNVKKALRARLDTSISTSMESLKAFFRLHSLTRKRHGAPPQPFSFFEKIHAHILQKGCGFIVLAFYEKRPIAGAMFFHFGTMAVYKYSASDISFQNLRANNLVMWEAIQWFCKNHIVKMVMGRTEMDNEGLRYYKSGWGAKEEILQYYKYNFATKGFEAPSATVPAFYTTIFKKLPVPILNAVGSLVYKYVA